MALCPLCPKYFMVGSNGEFSSMKNEMKAEIINNQQEPKCKNWVIWDRRALNQ